MLLGSGIRISFRRSPLRSNRMRHPISRSPSTQKPLARSWLKLPNEDDCKTGGLKFTMFPRKFREIVARWLADRCITKNSGQANITPAQRWLDSLDKIKSPIREGRAKQLKLRTAASKNDVEGKCVEPKECLRPGFSHRFELTSRRVGEKDVPKLKR